MKTHRLQLAAAAAPAASTHPQITIYNSPFACFRQHHQSHEKKKEKYAQNTHTSTCIYMYIQFSIYAVENGALTTCIYACMYLIHTYTYTSRVYYSYMLTIFMQRAAAAGCCRCCCWPTTHCCWYNRTVAQIFRARKFGTFAVYFCTIV